LVSRFNLSKSFNYTPYLFYKSASNQKSLLSEYGPWIIVQILRQRRTKQPIQCQPLLVQYKHQANPLFSMNIYTSLPRHNTAADRKLPEDLPQELWAAKCIWIRRRGGHVLPLSPLYDGPSTILQRSLRHFSL
jgi:hypothetical protein